MTWFDHGVLLVMGVSALVAVLRGFVREVLSLLSWVAAFVAARHGVRGPMVAFLCYSAGVFPALGFINLYPLRFADRGSARRPHPPARGRRLA